jgi:hypothetical protein
MVQLAIKMEFLAVSRLLFCGSVRAEKDSVFLFFL